MGIARHHHDDLELAIRQMIKRGLLDEALANGLNDAVHSAQACWLKDDVAGEAR
jgi:hypothetical protein